MKRIKLLLLVCIAVFVGAMLCGCGSDVQTESPLKKTYKSVKKIAHKSGGIRVKYIKDKEYLELGFFSGENVDKVFKVLSKNIKNKAIGTLYFQTLYDVEESEISDINDGISKLAPKSIMVLGMDTTLVESKNHSWTNVLPKTDVLYTRYVTDFASYEDSKDNLQKVKKLWLYNDTYSGISNFPNLEELGIYATVESTDDRASTKGKVYTTYGNTFSYPTKAKAEIVTNEKGEKVTNKPVEQPFEFNESYKEPDEYLPLKEAKNLKRITIAPCFEKYKMDAYGAAYLFALSNVRNDIMINKPNTKLTDNSYINIDELNKNNAQLAKNDINNIVQAYLSDEVKPTYGKAKKFKKKNKKHRVTDKALVYVAKPDSTMYKKKRVYHYSGSVLGTTELGNSIKMPERANDFKYFVYAYPTYKYYGKYNKGTKAYTETYWVQVFDMDKKIAYKPVKIGSKKPEQKFTYSGTPPAKHAGSVSLQKVYKAIKKLG